MKTFIHRQMHHVMPAALLDSERSRTSDIPSKKPKQAHNDTPTEWRSIRMLAMSLCVCCCLATGWGRYRMAEKSTAVATATSKTAVRFASQHKTTLHTESTLMYVKSEESGCSQQPDLD